MNSSNFFYKRDNNNYGILNYDLHVKFKIELIKLEDG